MITQAKDKAQQEGKKWSEYVVGLIEADCKKQNQQEEQQNSSVISILSNGQQLCITAFVPRLYENKTERDQQFQSIRSVDNEELIDFTKRLKDTDKMVKHRRFNESLEMDKKNKFRSMNTVIPTLDKLVSTHFGVTTNNKDKSIPNELDDIPIPEDNEG